MYLFFPLFFSAAGSTLGLHYESIIEAGQHFPIPVICGEHRLGETKTARVPLHLMDNRNVTEDLPSGNSKLRSSGGASSGL